MKSIVIKRKFSGSKSYFGPFDDEDKAKGYLIDDGFKETTNTTNGLLTYRYHKIEGDLKCGIPLPDQIVNARIESLNEPTSLKN